ncbi:MAG TPA: hypothetical protein VGD58_20205 [Herpetosiphonaceae bacterium]
MSLDHVITSLQHDLARLTQIAQRSDGSPSAAVQLARLQAAQAALKLAAVLLDATDPIAAQPIWQQFTAVSDDLMAWQHSGRGWFEERLVRRGQKRHGPYRYFRWRDEQGKTHTYYLGRIDRSAAAEPPIDAPPAIAEHPTVPASIIAPRETVQPVRINDQRQAHLRLPEPDTTTTLCTRPLGTHPHDVPVFAYDDCRSCRQAATRLGRICAGCGAPLVHQAAPGLCYSCARPPAG